MAISPQKQLNPPAPLKEVLMAQGAFGLPALGNQSRPWDTQGNLTAARDETFNNLRGISPARPMSNPFAPPPTGSTGGLLPMQGSESEARALAQNTATNALVNGDGMATVVPAAPAGAVDAAFGGLVNPFATPGISSGGLAPGMSAAMGVEGMRRGMEAERFNRLNIAPFMATLQQPGVSPEVASSRLGYFDKLALREAGMPADRAPNPVYRWVDAAGNLTLTNQEMDAGGRPVINLNQPGRTTEFDQNRQAVRGLAASGQQAISQQAATKSGVSQFGSPQELERMLPADKWDYKMQIMPDGSLSVKDISPRAPMPDVPNPLMEKIYTDLSTERRESVLPAISTLNAFSEINKILDSQDASIVSGAFAKPELLMRRIGTAMGREDLKVTDTQTLRALFAQPVAQMIKSFGAGTGLSDADREYAAAAVGGDITLDAAAIKRLSRIGEKAAKNVIKGYEERLEETFPEASANAQVKAARAALKLPTSVRGFTPEKMQRLQELRAKQAQPK